MRKSRTRTIALWAAVAAAVAAGLWWRSATADERAVRRVFARLSELAEKDGPQEGGGVLGAAAGVGELEELFDEYIRNALAECTPQHFPGGIILSGGVSGTPGLDRMLGDILQMPVRQVTEPIYAMPPGLDNAAYVSSAGILRYFVATEKDPYLFMTSDQTLPGLGRPQEEKPERTKKRASFFGGGVEEEEEEEADTLTEEPEYEEEEEEEEEEPRENIREMLGGFMDKIKKLF